MLRRFTVLLCLGAIAAVPLVAQTGIGIIGGYVSATVSLDPEQAGLTLSGRGGLVGGLSLGARLGGGASLGLEGLYVQKGADVHISTASASVKVNYLEVPLLLRIAIGNVHRPHLFVTGGAEYSFLMTCTETAAGTADIDCKKNATATSGVRSSDYGVLVGGGVVSGRFSLSIRYDLGLANLNNDTSTSGVFGPAPTEKNRAVMAMLGIALGK